MGCDRKVLVIDDNRVHAEGLAELLELSGFESSAVWTGLDGVEMAERLGVDAVLLDMDLPDIKGFEVCRRLRENPATSKNRDYLPSLARVRIQDGGS